MRSPPGADSTSENRGGVFGSLVKNSNRSLSVAITALSWSTATSASGPHTSTHSRQPVHFQGSIVAENSPPAPVSLRSMASKNARVRATG